MKKVFLSLLVLVGGICLTGCEKSNDVTLDNGAKLESKGNCVATECIKQIDVNNTVEEINQLIGFDGELVDEKYNQHYWELSEDSGIQVTYYSSSKGTIEVDIDKELLSNDKVDFSKYNEIKSLLDSGNSLTYDEFVTKVGGIQGTLIEKSSITNKYIWVNADGGYLNASFSVSSGKCTFVSGRF